MPDNILILGLGNILMGDEGVGVKVVEYLQGKALPEFVTLRDGGTGGLDSGRNKGVETAFCI
jgi:hydrogenase maturation protease